MTRALTLLLLSFAPVAWLGAATKQKTVPAQVKASAADTMRTFHDKVMGRFLDYYTAGIAEKLYIQTDKPYYCAGDSIWFKGTVCNAITHAPLAGSNFIYVELTGRGDSLLTRVKVRADSCGFHNCIRLSPDMPAGDYLLRAYTLWMTNQPTDHFFHKVIRVVNPLDRELDANVVYRRTPDGQPEAAMTLRGATMLPLSGARVAATVTSGGKERTVRLRTDSAGHVTVPLGESASRGTLRIEADDKGTPKGKTIHLPDFSTDFDVQFFPEGGPLVASVLQRVAFKAIGTNGLSVEVSGQIFSPSDEHVADIATTHLGMGVFSLIAASGEQFYALVRTKDGHEKRFTLPAATPGHALKMLQQRGRLIFEVLSSPGLDAGGFALVAHSHGRVMMADDCTPGRPKAIQMTGLPPGISHFALVRKGTFEPVSERLAFVPDSARLKIGAHASKPAYGARQKAEVRFTLRDAGGEPVSGGQWAVSVTDSQSVVWDSLGLDMENYLLLGSDLRGHIERPGYYFSSSSPEVAAAADLLMMTQGWTRFSLCDVLTGKTPPNAAQREDEHRIRGSVHGFFGGAAKSPTLLLFAPGSKYMDMFTLDGNNRFTLSMPDLPDSTSLIVQAVSRGGSPKLLTLKVEPERWPAKSGFIPSERLGDLPPPVPASFAERSMARYYDLKGSPVIDIDEVVVIATRPEERHTLYNVNATRSVDKRTLEAFAGSDLYAVLQTMPGVKVTGTEISIRGSHDAPLLYVDDMQMEIGELGFISVGEVERVDLVIGPEASIFGLGASGGVILVTLRSGIEYTSKRPPLPSMAHITPLGYKRPQQFYQPRYEVDSERERKTRDVRTTLLWQPCVKVDEQGNASVSFYTADGVSTYDVILEGVSPAGQVCRYRTRVERK